MKKKIKILQVIGALNIGGAENVAMNFSRYMDKTRFQIDYLVFGEEKGVYEEEALTHGSKVIHIDPPSKGYLQYLRELKKILNKGQYDIIHAHTLLNNGITLFVAYWAKIKKRISHSHSTNSGRKENIIYKFYAFIMKKMIRQYATHYLACGRDAGEYLYGKKIFKEQGLVLNNGIEITKFIFNRVLSKQIREDLEITDETVIGHIGRLTNVKNHDFLLEVFYEFQKIESNSKLLLVGDGELKEQIEQKIKVLGISDKVIMTGVRKDVENMLQAIDVVVFPSIFEGLPVTLIEAQAAGVPCLVSDNITSEIQITNLVKFLSLNTTPKDWAVKIIELNKLEKKEYSTCLKEKGYDIHTEISNLERIYQY